MITGVVAVGVGQFVASLGSQASSPVVAVGQAAIGLAPPPVKEFAITEFGSHDKMILEIGVLVVLALFMAVPVGPGTGGEVDRVDGDPIGGRHGQVGEDLAREK